LQFYDKFNIRRNIADILEYLWKIPAHQAAWKRFAVQEEKGFYLRFVNMLANDAIYLLDEALRMIPELKETEEEMADTARWGSLPRRLWAVYLLV
jgi:ubiquitin conjugation factor E4 B